MGTTVDKPQLHRNDKTGKGECVCGGGGGECEVVVVVVWGVGGEPTLT